MKFTIGTMSNFQQFEKALNLIKSSLLYADEIELIGLTEYVVCKYLPNILNCEKNLELFINDLIPFLKSINIPQKDITLQQIELARNQLQGIAPFLRKKKMRTKSEIQLQLQIHKIQKDLQTQLTTVINELFNQTPSQELKMLVDRSIVSIYDYNIKDINAEEMAGSYVGNLLNAIYTTNTYPLFDETSTEVISRIAKTKLLNISTLDEEILRHAGVATNILMTLPTLKEASIDELLDLKQQNAVPLVRFRKAIYEFSETISSLPWDNEFQYECIKLYNTKVAPQVAEINELFTETSTLKNLGKKVLSDEEIRKKAGFGIGGLATAITTSSSMSGCVRQLLFAMSIATFSLEASIAFLKVIDLGIKAYDDAKKAKKQGKENVMYYYYLASKI